ncbi:MAG TPA: SH3 domain-containing protein [Chloroflexota bacterium]|nr:SH3 domain-containing protein [Chloroflexota bacterium]
MVGIGGVVLLAACAGPEANPAPTASVQYIPTIAPAASASVSGNALSDFTNGNWGMVTSDPAKFVGAHATLRGEVFNVEQDETRVGLQMWTDPLHGSGNTIVVYPKQGFPVVTKGDQVEVEGKVMSAFSGTTDAGEVLKLPKVEASSVRIISVSSAAPSSGVSAGASVSGSASPSPSAGDSPRSSASPALTPTASAQPIAPGLFKVQGSEPTGLAIRAGPGINRQRLGVVHDGGVVGVLGQAAPGWAQVKGDGFTGYASMVYLSPIASSTVPLSKLTPR